MLAEKKRFSSVWCVKMCLARGWLVQRLDIENQLDLYAKAEEEIEFE